MGRPTTGRRSPIERMRLVARVARQIRVHPLVDDEANIRLTVMAGGGAEPAATVQGPEEHLLRSLLLDLRQLVAQREDSFLPGVLKLAVRHVDDPELAHALESAKDAHEAISRGSIGIVLDGRPLTGVEAVDLWINGAYFHRSPDKEARLASYTGVLASLTRLRFLEFVLEVSYLAVFVGSVIDEADRRGALRDSLISQARAHPHPTRAPAPSAPGSPWASAIEMQVGSPAPAP